MLTSVARPLFVIADRDLLDRLLQLASSAGVEPELAADPPGARASWAGAPLVVLDTAAARECVRIQLPRRRGVVLLTDTSGGSQPRDQSTVARPPADDDVIWKLAAQLDADHVVTLPAGESWLTDRLGETTHGRPGAVIGVIGGRGGAGASILASAIAVTAAVRRRVMLIDADPLGGGLDLLLGREDYGGIRWPDLLARGEGATLGTVYDGLPALGELALLSWDRGDRLEIPPEVLTRAVDAGRRGSDVVVIDLPRRPDAAARAALEMSDVVILVVPADVRSVASASRVLKLVRSSCREVRCVVRGPAPAGLKAHEVSEALRVPLIGMLRPEPSMAVSLERGVAPASRGRGPLADLSKDILDQYVPEAS